MAIAKTRVQLEEKRAQNIQKYFKAIESFSLELPTPDSLSVTVKKLQVLEFKKDNKTL